MLEADYIFMHTLLGTGDPGKMERAVNEILRHQNEDGGWSLYPGGPSNINYGVKCYFALKLMGWSADHPVHGQGPRECPRPRRRGRVQHLHQDLSLRARPVRLRRRPRHPARDRPLSRTGSTSTSTRSAPGRARILVPLSIIYAKKPFKKIPPEQGIDELFVGGRANADLHLRWDRKHPLSWRNFFLFTDRARALAERVHIRPLRKMALKKAEAVDARALRSAPTASAPSIRPCSTPSSRCATWATPSDDPQVIRAMDEFEKLGIDCPEGEPDYPTPTFRMQPCFSPVWDTAQVALDPRRSRRLAHRSAPAQGRRLAALQGDPPQGRLVAQGQRSSSPSGWCFFFNNDHQPDVDDTGEVLLALKAVDNPRERYQHEVDAARHQLGLRHAVQERRLGLVRQGQHQEDLRVDPVRRSQRDARSADGRHHRPHPRDARRPTATPVAIRASSAPSSSSSSEQEPDGAWFGRWGVNYLYGTFLVLRGLEAMEFSHLEPAVQQAAEWIRMVQNSDGGWGETCGTYDDPQPARHRPQHPLADSLGAPRPARRRRHPLRLRRQGHPLADRSPAHRRNLGRAPPRPQRRELLHRHRLPPRLLPRLPPVQQYFPLLALTTYKRAMERESLGR